MAKRFYPFLIIPLVLCPFWLAAAAPPIEAGAETVVFDFEDGSLGGWRIVEGHFERPVCDWDYFHNRPDSRHNKQGRYYLNTLEKKDGGRTDAFTGAIESPVFELEGPEISFLVGGGSHESVYVALYAEDGTELARARGGNDEAMIRVRWDASEYVGKSLFFRVVDGHTGGWGHITADDFRFVGRIDPEATEERFAERGRMRRERAVEEARRELSGLLDSLDRALAARQMAAAGARQMAAAEAHPGGEGEYQAESSRLRGALNTLEYGMLETVRQKVDDLRRGALLANAALLAHPILFVTRDQYLPDHHSTATMFQTGEINAGSFRGGGSLRTLDAGTGEVRVWVDCPEGIARDPEAHFSGERALFSMRRNAADDYHIYEIDFRTGGIEQLTFGLGLSDIDPMYLPDGRVCFVSTREPKYCQCNRHIMGNLFVMDADGGNLHQIGRNTLFECNPSLLSDGRILYSRWEYVDKHFGPAFGLWTCNPDGTNHAVYYGNNAWSPGAVLDAREITRNHALRVPGTGLAVATLGSCHDRPWGAIALLDRTKGLDGTGPVVHSWPPGIESRITNRRDYGDGMARHHPAGGQIDNFVSMPVKYEDPFPLTDTHFLCARTVEGERTALVLLDAFGNETVVHEEPGAGCFDPMPVRPGARPPVIPPRVARSESGYFYIADVYTGTGMDLVPRGEAKTLRVVEAPPKLHWTQTNWNLDATQAPAMNFNSTNNKRILGDVPVEADGSAYFEVPADTFVFFQLLDGDGMMIQSMRSGTMVRPGETLGCVGCHDNRLTAYTKGRTSLSRSSMRSEALQRPAARIKPWRGPARDFNYLTEVQPVFDQHCVSCHDYGQPAGDVLNLSGDLGLVFNTSYLELRRKSALRWFPDPPGAEKLLVKAVDDGPAEALPPYSWGSKRSRLIDVMRSGHQGIELDDESLDRVIAWIDMNAPYYGSYASAYPDNAFGRSPLNDDQIGALRRLTGVEVGTLETELNGSQCNFTRPEFSPCLEGLEERDPEAYREALAILREGAEALKKRPRMDMPGAELPPAALEKLRRYESMAEAERRSARAALPERPR